MRNLAIVFLMRQIMNLFFYSWRKRKMDTRKYIFENGVMKINPAFKAQQANKPSTVAAPDQALAIVSSTQDIMEATDAQYNATGKPMQLSEATTSSMEIMQDGDFIDKFNAPNQINSSKILDELSNVFAKYEIPIGLINKLLALSEYKLNFIIDDSGSMSGSSDAPLCQASEHIKHKVDPQGIKANNFNAKMTRWEEAEDRLHVMMDMLAYIPTDNITISFLNRGDKIHLDHKNKSTEQFAQEAHQKIFNAFSKNPTNGTPVYKRLSESLNQATGATMHYLFTDGVPTDASVDKLKELVKSRGNPQKNPLTFMSCTDEDSEAEWMKEIEEAAPYTAELDDFEDEKREVLKDQGPGFPYSKGFWLLCQLVAAINPHDLDAIDESVPFTKQTMDNLLGRKLTIEEYQHYFRNNPNAQKYSNLFNEFAREDIMAKQILDNLKGGYSNHGSTYNQTTTSNPIVGYHTGNPSNNSGYSSGNPGNPGNPNNYSGNSGYTPGFWNSPPNQGNIPSNNPNPSYTPPKYGH